MYSVAYFGQRITHSYSCFCIISRSIFSSGMFNSDSVDNAFGKMEDYLNRSKGSSYSNSNVDEKSSGLLESLGLVGSNGENENHSPKSSNLDHTEDEKSTNLLESLGLVGSNGEIESPSPKSSNLDHTEDEKLTNLLESLGLIKPNIVTQNSPSLEMSFFEKVKSDATKILEILQQEVPEYDAKASLDKLNIRVTGLLVREVLLQILKMINYGNKTWCAKLGHKFFIWSSQQKNYIHTVNAYHLMMKIFSESEEFKEMWRLVDEMIVKDYPITARTFNIMICTCGEAGLARQVIERFIKSKTFRYRPFKHSFNAILHSLLAVNHYKLIEWVYQKMLFQGHTPDILTYNIILCAKYRLGKLNQFHRVLDEMGRNGFSPDFHTFNLFLHVLGKGNKPLAALNLMNHMKEQGIDPSVLHFTTLIDGLSRAGNLNACEYFYNEMIKQGIIPDVVCYTVMITGYVVAREFEKAQEVFDEMIRKEQMPNVFTYNSMIRGFCMAGKFKEASLMLNEMELKGCNPNFLVYSTFVSYLRKAGKLYKAHKVIRKMVEKGRCMNLVSKMKNYRIW